MELYGKGDGYSLGTSSGHDWRHLTDCHYFSLGQCRSDNCKYRHCETAKASRVNCRYWNMYTCTNIECPFKHPGFGACSKANPSPSAERELVAPAGLTDIRKGHTATGSNHDSFKIPRASDAAMCAFFMRGRCTKGSSCPYAHTRVELPLCQESAPTATSHENVVKAVESTSSNIKVQVVSDGKIAEPATPSTSVVPAEQSRPSSGKLCTKRRAADILNRHSFKKSVITSGHKSPVHEADA